MLRLEATFHFWLLCGLKRFRARGPEPSCGKAALACQLGFQGWLCGTFEGGTARFDSCMDSGPQAALG